jgi:hypothetical protein
VNYGLAPRSPTCWVCQNVGMVEDVTMRLLDEGGRSVPNADAIEYLESIGHSASKGTWGSRLLTHRKHVLRSFEKPVVVTPAKLETGVIKLNQPAGSPTWLRTTDRAVDLGDMALDTLEGRMALMEDGDLIALARLGVGAAKNRGDWEAKGRRIGQMDALLQIVSGHGSPDAD